ncbi:hypothetical protein CAPTEDRAFT_219483 [Capitella teleta]|uniref:G-protein coupled receptors family 2 profile 2 domain-containing protein n=1 Tax=Capitella teleta TaxID=283909 RepID=X2APM1_CAPTE|nr:hypothetical protein CAPTEDRAFT_219483 [Capitella teleta]|eukprot:ELU10117.1 hypothetical protein CAPTEDRAFT_219483 [Capitella teleta]
MGSNTSPLSTSGGGLSCDRPSLMVTRGRCMTNTTVEEEPAPAMYSYRSLEECLDFLGPRGVPPPGDDRPYCPGTFDLVLCWPATLGGTTAKQACPPLRGLDTTHCCFEKNRFHDENFAIVNPMSSSSAKREFGFKVCSADGQWEGIKPGNYSKPQGWTNYTQCYTKDSYDLYKKMFSKASPKTLKEIARVVKIIEAVGLCTSFVSLAISIIIFCYYRTLRCDRTRMHRNLFVAILIHVSIQLVQMMDAYIERSTGASIGGSTIAEGTISSTPVLCECLLTLIEYTKTVMFMWMFIEGMYLHNMLVVSVFSGKPNYLLYYIMGWGFPCVPTLAWAITTGILMKGSKCWFGYHFDPYFWIQEGPRAAIITINLFFLLNIIRVLVTKLQENHSNEALQVKKAVKAAIVLLPLLGITNFIQMVDPQSPSVVGFAIWSFAAHFFVPFQGFFIALIYCFLNGEVQNTLRLQWERRMQTRGGYASGRRRLSRSLSVFTSVTEVPNQLLSNFFTLVVFTSLEILWNILMSLMNSTEETNGIHKKSSPEKHEDTFV